MRRDDVRIRRSRLTADYVQIPNGTVRDSRLSYMARGILAELLSRPDGWEATADEMWRQAADARGNKSGEGRRAFRAAFAELKEFGYLVASREQLAGGKRATVLTAHDVPAGRTDVPYAGTSEATDVPHAGTSVPPGQTSIPAGRTDVPVGGTPDSPAETPLSAAHSDVPHGGTSKEENGEKKTGEKKTSSSAAAASPRDLTAEEKKEFGNFWALYPKSRDRDKTLAEWTAAVLSGVDPKQITAAAVAYAKEKAGEEFRFIKHSTNWLRERRYLDDYAPEPNGRPNLRPVNGSQRRGGARSELPTHEDFKNGNVQVNL